LRGYNRDRAMSRVEGIYRQLQQIFTVAKERGISTASAAKDYAEERIRDISRIRQVRVAEFGPLSDHR
jgi:leucine dehydrogenase